MVYFSEKDGDPVRKSFLFVLVILLLAVCACAAADTEYPLTPCSGRIKLNTDTYVVLTSGNLADHPDLLTAIGKTSEELLKDWEERGVQLQAWSKSLDVCLEVTVVQDDDSIKYYDLEKQTRKERNEFLKRISGGKLSDRGYLVLSGANVIEKPELKKQTLGGNFVRFEYRHTDSSTKQRGLGCITVRNGYTVFLDYQVFNRLPRDNDLKKLNPIANTVAFDDVDMTAVAQSAQKTENGQVIIDTTSVSVPANAASMFSVTTVLPEKTNTGIFTVEGTAYPGSEISVVAMDYTKLTTPSCHFSGVTGTNGKYKVKVTLPQEATYQVVVNNDIGSIPVAYKYLNQIIYSKFALSYQLDNPIPDQLTSDELVISGTTDKGVTIQCIVTNGTSTFDKTVKTNGTGKFRFKVPTKEEAEYDITVVFSKKNLSTERLNVKASRNLTEQDTRTRTAEKAKKMTASYSALVRNLNTYIGETMVYSAHILSVEQVGEEWIITAAARLNNKTYSNYLYYMAKGDPGLTVGSKVKLYGVCRGAYQYQSEEGSDSYPCFDFLFFE